MKLKIEKEVNNPLLKRKEIVVIAEDINQTPSRKEILAQVAAVTGNIPDKIAIDKIQQEFGQNKAIIHAKVYETKEDKDKIEPKFKEKRLAGKEKSKIEEPKKEETTKPTEPAKEEKGEEKWKNMKYWMERL